jgi:hypothetical protein
LAAQEAHERAVEERVAPHLRRRTTGEKHPVEDFLFTYYRHRPGALRRWHPGAGVLLSGPSARRRLRWRWYREAGFAGRNGVGVDVERFVAQRGVALAHTARVLRVTGRRSASFGCFGLHEWAMVYRLPEGAQRHEAWPLRLGARATDEVVETHQLVCTHFDAYRFFTPDAVPRNAFAPTRSGLEVEQPGCLHATMDLYRHAYTLAPAVGSDLVLACFDLARDVRTLDMQASPYDLRDLGYRPIAVETSQGKAEYARRQREFAARAVPLRRRLLEVAESLIGPDIADRA